MSDKQERDDRFVGPVIKAGEMAEAVLEAVQEDNEGRQILTEEHASYVRIWVMDECILNMDTVSRMLGRPISIGDIEVNMPGFSGFIQTSQSGIRFYAKH
ncbi:MmoB/DmpM family protein [Limibacillus sp. MBR-115]|jgi:toluene monooxygenase system protein D|uniref:MmoB/DmpM family protein n=1 Tax=Limibacillus sp. MBR-115 TaxID=3156465 RepID=UPI00339A7177